MSSNLEPTDRREEVKVRRRNGVEQRERIVVDRVAERRLTLHRISQIILLLLIILEMFIGLRIVLRLFAANSNAAFAKFVNTITTPFLKPFAALFSTMQVRGLTVELNSLIAMLVYAVAALIIVQAIWLLFNRTSTRSVSTYRRMD